VAVKLIKGDEHV